MKKKACYSTTFNSMFREYDIRGHVSEDELNPDSVYRIVLAYGRYLNNHRIQKAVVGYDNRECSPAFAEAAVRALRETGIEVFYIGLTLSPITYYAQYRYQCEGACMITASHNPNDWSGFKFANGYSKTLETNDIEELYLLVDISQPLSAELGAYHEVDVRDDYINEVVSRISMGSKKVRIVLDAGNGGAGLFIYEVFQKLGCLTFQLHCDPDITYPNYFPNPSNTKSRQRLKEMVTNPYIHADLGISFDGDGDRIGVIDDKGNNIWSDMILAVLAKQMLQKNPDQKIVYDVKCTKALQDVIEQNGGTPVMWKTGHSYIKAKLHETKAVLAGERSGHIFIGGTEYYGFDDAVFAAAKLVEYLSNEGRNLSDIIDEFPHYVTSPEIKAYCKDEEKYQVVEKIITELKEDFPGKVNDINGARVQFDNGFGLVRASSNLPELVLIFEADTMENMLEIRSLLRSALHKHKEISSIWENDIEITKKDE